MPNTSAEEGRLPSMARLSSFIVERFAPVGDRGLNDTTSLVKSGWLDSFAVVELVAFIEREFQVVLKNEDITPANFETLEAMRRLLDRAVPR
jgi:acyl carrier protein